jgi:hypothetical protein
MPQTRRVGESRAYGVEFGTQRLLRRDHVDGKTLLYLAELLKVPVQELFRRERQATGLRDFMEKLETTRF